MSELFNGTWAIDVSASSRFDADRAEYVPDEIGEEVIRLRVTGDEQDYEVLYGDRPTIRMGYTSRYDSAEWVRYEVREITNADGNVDEAVQALRRRIGADRGTSYREFRVGECYALVRTITVDERTHYRVAKYADSGRPQNMMLRRLSEDGQSYLASVLDVDGVVNRRRLFRRVS